MSRCPPIESFSEEEEEEFDRCWVCGNEFPTPLPL